MRRENSIKNHKKSVGIVIGVVVVALGLVVILIPNAENTIVNQIIQIPTANPFQTYKINTNCELSYRMFDSIHTQNRRHILTVPAMLYTDTELALRLQEKYANIENLEDKMNAINAELFEISVKRTMESNSINPVLEQKIRFLIESFQSGYYQNLESPLTSQDIVDDPECAEKMKMYYPQMVNMR